MLKKTHSSQGFTLVELLITIAISGVIVAAVYSAYRAQQRIYLAQEQVAELQMNLRAAVDVMVREIRMAGYDPSGKAGATITVADAGQLGFTMDLDGDESLSVSENISYGLLLPADSSGVAPLGRSTGGPLEPIAENIQAVDFFYILNDGTETSTPAILDEIQAVNLSILARTTHPDNNFNNSMTYTAASGVTWGPFDDNYRRRLLSTTIHLRNRGL